MAITGRKFFIKNFFKRLLDLILMILCAKNIGAEDYIKILEVCEHILIENLPNFDDNNSNQQQRFITLIDIIYEKKVSLTISSVANNWIGTNFGIFGELRVLFKTYNGSISCA